MIVRVSYYSQTGRCASVIRTHFRYESWVGRLTTLLLNIHSKYFHHRLPNEKKAKLIKVTARIMHSFRTLPLLHTMTPPAETNISSTATRCSVSSIVEARTDQTYSKDFRCLPIPRRLRYDPDKPFYFGMPLNVSFAIGSTFGEP
jgi:hypothetical protein